MDRRRPLDPPDGAPLSPEYASEVTDESFKELERLTLTAHAQGPGFYLIGGWAAWIYHGGLGSRDIDLVFEDPYLLDTFLLYYYKKSGYTKGGRFLQPRYRKRVMVAGKVHYIEIDAAAIDEGPPFKEDPSQNIHFHELKDYSITKNLNGISHRVPRLELLVLQKTKAWRDRNHDLQTTAQPADVRYLQSKIWKDAYDIDHLLAKVTDWSIVQEILDRNRTSHLFLDTMHRLGHDVPIE